MASSQAPPSALAMTRRLYVLQVAREISHCIPLFHDHSFFPSSICSTFIHRSSTKPLYMEKTGKCQLSDVVPPSSYEPPFEADFAEVCTQQLLIHKNKAQIKPDIKKYSTLIACLFVMQLVDDSSLELNSSKNYGMEMQEG